MLLLELGFCSVTTGFWFEEFWFSRFTFFDLILLFLLLSISFLKPSKMERRCLSCVPDPTAFFEFGRSELIVVCLWSESKLRYSFPA